MDRRTLLLLPMAALGVSSLLAGCSESVMIRSQPPGAQAYVNDRAVGLTPSVFLVRKGDLQSSYRLRLEKEGYEPYADVLRTHFAGGRFTGALFTLGIVYLFKSPTFLVPPPLAILRPSLEAERDRRLGQELRAIEKLRAEGRITQDEFEQRRNNLLDEEK